jgi:FtsH-binding integral membrane protein
VAMCEECCDEAKAQITGCSNKKDFHSCCRFLLVVIGGLAIFSPRVVGIYMLIEVGLNTKPGR